MIKKFFSTIVLFVFIITSFGCVVAPAPRHAPPPRKIRIKSKRPGPNYIWVKGHWEWKRGRYVWRNGYWKKRKKNRRWVSGHWKKGPAGWVWVPGHWR